jgi:hypothetical protein
MLAAATVGLLTPSAGVPARAATVPKALEPATLRHAQAIRAELDSRYRQLSGQRLTVAEATTLTGLRGIALIHDVAEPPRIVSAANGIYYSICMPRARCPHPAHPVARPASAALPRRAALELALRTFRVTTADLVVVALPSEMPIWVVFERDELLVDVDVRSALERLRGGPATVDMMLRRFANRLTRSRLYRALPFLLPPEDILYALRLELT